MINLQSWFYKYPEYLTPSILLHSYSSSNRKKLLKSICWALNAVVVKDAVEGMPREDLHYVLISVMDTLSYHFWPPYTKNWEGSETDIYWACVNYRVRHLVFRLEYFRLCFYYSEQPCTVGALSLILTEDKSSMIYAGKWQHLNRNLRLSKSQSMLFYHVTFATPQNKRDVCKQWLCFLLYSAEPSVNHHLAFGCNQREEQLFQKAEAF